jgi:hypothetical protein
VYVICGITMARAGERVNSLFCSFDMNSPRTSAYIIHEWVYNKLGLTDDDLLVLQIDGAHRNVYLKFVTMEKMYSVLQKTGGKVDYVHESGELPTVTIDVVGMGVHKVRIANLLPDLAVRVVLSNYGEIRGVSAEKLATSYRLSIPNGIRVVQLLMKKHIPSSLMILGQGVMISYECQPITCGEEGHLYHQCQHRRSRAAQATMEHAATWAETAAGTCGR